MNRVVQVFLSPEIEMLYRGSMGLADDLFLNRFICWERDDHTMSQLHVTGGRRDGDNHQKTYCGCLVRRVVGADSETAVFFKGMTALNKAKLRKLEACHECMGSFSASLRKRYRRTGELIDDLSKTWDEEVEIDRRREMPSEYQSEDHPARRDYAKHREQRSSTT